MDKPIDLTQYYIAPFKTRRFIIEEINHADPDTLIRFLSADNYAYSKEHWLAQDLELTEQSICDNFLPKYERNSYDQRILLIYRREQGNEKGEPVGTLTWFCDTAGRIRITPYILPSYRERGINSEVYPRAQLEMCKITDQDHAHIEILPNNLPQIRLMEKLGAKFLGEALPDQALEDDNKIHHHYEITKEALQEWVKKQTARSGREIT